MPNVLRVLCAVLLNAFKVGVNPEILKNREGRNF